jgi:putative transposase
MSHLAARSRKTSLIARPGAVGAVTHIRPPVWPRLRVADRSTVAETARKNKVSERTIYSWRKHFGELAPSDVRRLRPLEAENARPKRLLAERDLDISVLKEINAKKW